MVNALKNLQKFLFLTVPVAQAKNWFINKKVSFF